MWGISHGRGTLHLSRRGIRMSVRHFIRTSRLLWVWRALGFVRRTSSGCEGHFMWLWRASFGCGGISWGCGAQHVNATWHSMCMSGAFYVVVGGAPHNMCLLKYDCSPNDSPCHAGIIVRCAPTHLALYLENCSPSVGVTWPAEKHRISCHIRLGTARSDSFCWHKSMLRNGTMLTG